MLERSTWPIVGLDLGPNSFPFTSVQSDQWHIDAHVRRAHKRLDAESGELRGERSRTSNVRILYGHINVYRQSDAALNAGKHRGLRQPVPAMPQFA